MTTDEGMPLLPDHQLACPICGHACYLLGFNTPSDVTTVVHHWMEHMIKRHWDKLLEARKHAIADSN